MTDLHPLSLALGGVTLRLSTEDGDVRRLARRGLRRWRAPAGGPAGVADAAFDLRLRRVPRYAGGGRSWNGAAWSGGGGRYDIAARWFRIGVDCGRRRLDAVVDARYGLGDFYRSLLGVTLALHDGFLLHAAALAVPGGGVWLFSGPSGYGKTTLARLAPRRAVLADETTAIRVAPKPGTAVLAYPTPFFGEYGKPPAGLRPGGRPLRRIFLLARPSPRRRTHAVEPVSPAAAATAILSQVFMGGGAPAEVQRRILDRAAAVAERVPVYRLAYRPDRSVWAFLRDFVTRNP